MICLYPVLIHDGLGHLQADQMFQTTALVKGMSLDPVKLVSQEIGKK